MTRPSNRRPPSRRAAALALVAGLALAPAPGSSPLLAAGGAGTSTEEAAAPSPTWGHYGGDAAGTQFSPLDQIERGNVAQLERVWTYRTGHLDGTIRERSKITFETTPIQVGELLVLSTPFNVIIALDGETGREVWRFDPQVDLGARFSEVKARGVSHWRDASADAASRPCRDRILFGTLDARLIAIDATSGETCRDFGDAGTVDLTRDVGLDSRPDYQVTSPPAVLGDLVIVGSAVGDNRRVDVERGIVRAFDARSGAPAWSWDPIPRDPALRPPGAWLPEGRPTIETGAANAWAPVSVDEERDLVFLPTGSAAPDFYGGERPGDNRYANSVVALRGTTGEVVWHFQTVHHDLWDYDVPAQPTLVTLRRGGAAIPAVVQGTKTGAVFVLHRETGEPLFPVEERPVPESDVPGEWTSVTQPWPVAPPPLTPERFRLEEVYGPTPAARQECLDLLRSVRYEGIFTPPSLGGTLQYPGNGGGMNWGGTAWDPDRQIVVAGSNRMPTIVQLHRRHQWKKRAAESEGRGEDRQFTAQEGTPYGMSRFTPQSSLGVPCVPPPWGLLSAVDLEAGELLWQVPVGELQGIRGIPAIGGPLVTAGGLVFFGATQDGGFRALDIETGAVLWEVELEHGAHANPMTFRTASGRQLVVVAAGGYGDDDFGKPPGDLVVAYGLPRSNP